MFFLAFLPQFVAQDSDHFAMQVLLLGLLFMLQAVVIFCLIGYFFRQHSSYLFSRPKCARFFDWLTAGVITALGNTSCIVREIKDFLNHNYQETEYETIDHLTDPHLHLPRSWHRRWCAPTWQLRKNRFNQNQQPIKRAQPPTPAVGLQAEYADCVGSNCQYTYSRCKAKLQIRRDNMVSGGGRQHG